MTPGSVYREGSNRSLRGTVLFQWEKFPEEELFSHMQTGLTSSPLKWSGKRLWSDLSSRLRLCYSAWRVLTWAKKTQWAPDFGPRSSLVTNFQENHFCPPQSSSAPQTRGPNSQDSWFGDGDTCHCQNISILTEMIKNRKNLQKVLQKEPNGSHTISYRTFKTEDTGSELLITPVM